MGKLSRLLLPLFLLLLVLPPEREAAAASEPILPEAAPVVQVIPPPAEPELEEEADGPALHAVGECVITYYDTCVLCCGKADGITASGTKAVPCETCAVDPAVIPLGSVVLVDFGDGVLRRYRAEDTGGSVAGNRVDVCVASHEEAVELGVRQAMVWWEESTKAR